MHFIRNKINPRVLKLTHIEYTLCENISEVSDIGKQK